MHRVVIDDLRQTQIRRDFGQELRDLYNFYVDDERRAELERMGRIRRAFTLLAWLLKSLLLKLSPARRLALLVALLCGIAGPTSISALGGQGVSFDPRPLGIVILLVILMLELRDKLMAKDEIAVARQVQQQLLPDSHPDLPGWSIWSHSRPANDVGGDLVDYVTLDEFRQGVTLGDVSGKGLGAALLTAKLQATLRAILPVAASLDDLGRQVNIIFCRDGMDNRFATLFFAELQQDSGHVRYLNAGHDPPFVIRDEGIDRLPASSYPLGMLESAKYEEGSLDLQPGEMILAYSDGLTEAANEAGEEYGAARVEALIPDLRGLTADQVGARILKEVDRFIGDTRLADDLSIAVIRRE